MNKISLLVLALVIVTSCQNEKSLQQFIVNQQEKSEIISFDLPASMLSLQENMQSSENIKTLKTIKKANILVFKINDLNKEIYLTEKEQLRNILKQQKYAELMRFGKGSKGAKVHMVGSDDAIDELIVFANDDELGWLLVRILGSNMQPEKIMQIINKMDFDNSDLDLSKLKDILSNESL